MEIPKYAKDIVALRKSHIIKNIRRRLPTVIGEVLGYTGEEEDSIRKRVMVSAEAAIDLIPHLKLGKNTVEVRGSKLHILTLSPINYSMVVWLKHMSKFIYGYELYESLCSTAGVEPRSADDLINQYERIREYLMLFEPVVFSNIFMDFEDKAVFNGIEEL